QAEDGIRYRNVTGVQTCALPIFIRDDRVLLLRNERDEWELPGGKIEIGETPEECLAREIEEETGWPVQVAGILDSWMYHITQVRSEERRVGTEGRARRCRYSVRS